MQKTLRRSWTQLVAVSPLPSRVLSRMPMVRQPTSPTPGRSIWMTSAPMSAASAAPNGWAIRVPLEMIFTP